MSTALIVNAPPYGSEIPCNAPRLAGALALEDELIEGLVAGTVRDPAELVLHSDRVLGL